MNVKPKILVLKADGTNCDEETAFAFELAGAKSEIVHINQLRTKNKKLKNYKILAIPGGFSYGDDVASGKILAVELTSFLKDEVEKFRQKGGLIIGICNGFQVLIRTGLLPFGFAQGKPFGKMDATLAPNDSGHFECRWVRVKSQKSKCVFLQGQYDTAWMSVNHGEGKFLASNKTIKTIEQSGLVIFRYIDNPNGSINDIAGVCDPTGRVLGLMPHPEKFVDITQYPNWRREQILRQVYTERSRSAQGKPHGAFFFEEMIKFVKQS